MSSNRKRWIGLPFLGASEGKDHDQRESTRNGKKFLERNPRSTGAAVEREVTLSKTAADTFKDKDEEDIVQDYNSPIHMWVSGEPQLAIATLVSRSCFAGHCDIVSSDCWYLWTDGIDVQHMRNRHLLESSGEPRLEGVQWTTHP